MINIHIISPWNELRVADRLKSLIVQSRPEVPRAVATVSTSSLVFDCLQTSISLSSRLRFLAETLAPPATVQRALTALT
jgi:hypothetical protein